MSIKRTTLEANERLILAPYAVFSADSYGREMDEPRANSRTMFQRDRDRVIHTSAFRRLEFKTQVFVFYEGDHYRNRLTHTIEVSQIGRSIARALGANEDLTEAICLAHDLGHPPFGHAGEDVLDELMKDHGGYNHNIQSLRIVTKLEKPYPTFDGLNLSYETREGLVKHQTAHARPDSADYQPELQGSLEAQIADLADEMAYNAHDLDDGLRSGLITPADLNELEIWKQLKTELHLTGDTLTRLEHHAIIRKLIALTVGDVLLATEQRLQQHNILSVADVRKHPHLLATYSAEMQAKITPLKLFLLHKMYHHYKLVRMKNKAERILTELFVAYAKDPAMLPTHVQAQLHGRNPNRVITDYLAGMTDRYALDEWNKLFAPYP